MNPPLAIFTTNPVNIPTIIHRCTATQVGRWAWNSAIDPSIIAFTEFTAMPTMICTQPSFAFR
ncbi:hypothetical protein ACWYXJ_12425 [Janthinobacterium lividum]